METHNVLKIKPKKEKEKEDENRKQRKEFPSIQDKEEEEQRDAAKYISLIFGSKEGSPLAYHSKRKIPFDVPCNFGEI